MLLSLRIRTSINCKLLKMLSSIFVMEHWAKFKIFKSDSGNCLSKSTKGISCIVRFSYEYDSFFFTLYHDTLANSCSFVIDWLVQVTSKLLLSLLVHVQNKQKSGTLASKVHDTCIKLIMVRRRNILEANKINKHKLKFPTLNLGDTKNILK